MELEVPALNVITILDSVLQPLVVSIMQVVTDNGNPFLLSSAAAS